MRGKTSQTAEQPPLSPERIVFGRKASSSDRIRTAPPSSPLCLGAECQFLKEAQPQQLDPSPRTEELFYQIAKQVGLLPLPLPLPHAVGLFKLQRMCHCSLPSFPACHPLSTWTACLPKSSDEPSSRQFGSWAAWSWSTREMCGGRWGVWIPSPFRSGLLWELPVSVYTLTVCSSRHEFIQVCRGGYTGKQVEGWQEVKEYWGGKMREEEGSREMTVCEWEGSISANCSELVPAGEKLEGQEASTLKPSLTQRTRVTLIYCRTRRSGRFTPHQMLHVALF